MIESVARLRRKQENGEDGFTLIELLVVVVIIGVLIAIAVPLYLNYRQGANDKAAQSDVRSAVTALEQCMAENGSYPSAVPEAGGTPTGCVGGKVTVSENVKLNYGAATGSSPSAYRVVAKHDSGSKKYCYASNAGGSVTDVADSVTGYGDAC